MIEDIITLPDKVIVEEGKTIFGSTLSIVVIRDVDSAAIVEIRGVPDVVKNLVEATILGIVIVCVMDRVDVKLSMTVDRDTKVMGVRLVEIALRGDSLDIDLLD
jgi:hypothetical protein